MSNTEAEIAKFEEAYRRGYTGDRAIQYARAIPGDTLDEVRENAETPASLVEDLHPSREPERDRDDGDAEDQAAAARRDFRDFMLGFM